MSLKKKKQTEHEFEDIKNVCIKKNKQDVLERFLSVLWRREVDLKFTTK